VASATRHAGGNHSAAAWVWFNQQSSEQEQMISMIRTRATVLGIAIWGEWPDVWSLAGVAVLIAPGLYIWHREVTLGIRR
jgi:hypothetical protein